MAYCPSSSDLLNGTVSPEQLVSDKAKMGVISLLDKEKLLLGDTDLEGELDRTFKLSLAINHYSQGIGVMPGNNRQVGVFIEYHAAVTERMRADRGEGDDLGGGMNDGAASRQVVGGGTGRGGEYQAVAIVLVDFHAVAQDLD